MDRSEVHLFSRIDDETASDVLIESLSVTDEDIRRISGLPQRSDEWHQARAGRITGSRVGGCIGSSEYDTPDSILKSMLWGSEFKGNAATRRGTEMEPVAQKSVSRIIKRDRDPGAELLLPGLIVCKSDPIFAYSPDGIIVFSNGSRCLIEIKVNLVYFLTVSHI